MSKQILIADDTTFIRTTMRQTLEAAGYQIIGEATDGASVIPLYTTLQPDLLILNILMPKMSGLQVLRELKSHAPQARVLICSAMGQASSVFSAIRSGADDFLMKPFDDRQLIEAVALLIGVPERIAAQAKEPPPEGSASASAPSEGDDDSPFAKLALEAEEALNSPTDSNP